MARKIKLFNGGDWNHRGGHLYVGAHSVKDAVGLVSIAYNRAKGYPDDKAYCAINVSAIQVYWSKGCWGDMMKGITPERGVWWAENEYGMKSREPPRRLV